MQRLYWCSGLWILAFIRNNAVYTEVITCKVNAIQQVCVNLSNSFDNSRCIHIQCACVHLVSVFNLDN